MSASRGTGVFRGFRLVCAIVIPALPLTADALTWSLNGGSESWPADKRTAIVNAMNQAVALYNAHGYFDKHVTANYDASVPTANGSYSGWINFGGSINTRVALHEISHTLGVGTYWNWSPKVTAGKWTGARALARVKLYDGTAATIGADTAHFWPYGLNFDSEDGTTNRIRHIRVVSALRWDMGIVTDSDADGMPDDWERFWFNGLTQAAGDDFDKDGTTNANEYAADTDPTTDFTFTWKTGAGTWDGVTANWTGPATVWRNGGDDTAVFGGSAGTVTTAAGVSVSRMTFNTTSYQIAGATLAMTGTDPGVTVASGVSATVDSVLSGSRGFTKSGAGTLTLGGASNFTGALAVEGGTLALSSGGRLYMSGGSAGLSISGGGILSFTGGWGWDGTFRYMGVTAAENRIDGGTLRHTGTSNAKSSAGAGRLFTIGAAGATLDSATAGQEFSIGYRYDYSDSLASEGGTLTLTGDGHGDLNYRIPGTGGLVKRGAGTWVLSSAGNSFSGGTTIGVGNNAGTVGGILKIANATALGSGNISVIAGDPTSTNRGAQLQLSGGITLANPIIILSGLGYGANLGVLLNASGNNSLTGTIQLGSGAGGSIIASDAGTLGLGPITATSTARTLEFTGAGNFSASGVISDGSTVALPVTKTGAGTLTLTAANTFSGITNVQAGVLNLRHASALGAVSGNTVVADGARIELEGGVTTAAEPLVLSGTGGASFFYGALNSRSGSNTWSGPVTIATPGTRVGTLAGATLLVSGPIGSSGGDHGLVVRPADSSSPVILSGVSTYGGPTTVFGGTLRLDGGNQRLPATTVVTLGTAGVSGTLDLNGRQQSVAGLAVGQTSGTFSNVVTNSSATASTLTVNLAPASSFAGSLSGNLALTKTGSGELTLSGSQSHSGGTVVSGGSLVVTGNLGPSTVTLANGGVLGGNGTTGAVLVQSGGILSPGMASPGTLRTGALTLASGSICRMRIGQTSDRLEVTGNLALGGTLQLTDTGTAQGMTYTLITYTGSLTGSVALVPPAGFSARLDTSSAGLLRVVLTPNDLGTWNRTHFTAAELANPAISGPSATPAGDGMSNLMKYALGLPPKTPATASMPMEKSGVQWVLRYQRPADRPDLQYRVRFSDLGGTGWTSNGVVHERIQQGNTETWQASMPATHRAGFLRLEVSRP